MTAKEAIVSDNDENVRPPGLGLRHAQALMLFFAMTIGFAMRVNMSMAVVAMTDSTTPNAFDWSVQTQSVILSSFFWGYVILQIPSGELAARFGGKVLLTWCIAINSTVSLLLPIGSYYGGWQLVCACRVLQGLTQGCLFPATHNLIGKWVPLQEKSQLGTLIYAGSQLGTALQLMASGFIVQYWGWPAIFYVDGAIGAAWVAVYVFIGASSPQTSRMISEKEKYYIQKSLGQQGEPKKLQTPWKSIMTSLPFYALIIVHCGHNWGFWTLMTEIPSYFRQVLGVDIRANGVISALPYLAMYALSFPLGYVSDLCLRKKWLSISASRKLSNSIGHYGPALALIGLSYSPAGNLTVAVVLITLVVGLNAGHYTGYLLVHIDMAPNFGGTLMGITNCIANIISLIAPLAAGALLQDETDPSEWRKVFYVASAIYIAGNTFFVIFGSCEVQPWNAVPDDVLTNKDAEAPTTVKVTEKASEKTV